jgi:hypothetical protein
MKTLRTTLLLSVVLIAAIYAATAARAAVPFTPTEASKSSHS